jgi:hypothetical protein
MAIIWQLSIVTFCRLIYCNSVAHSAEHPLEKRVAAESDEWQLSDKMICIIQQSGDCTKEFCQRSILD